MKKITLNTVAMREFQDFISGPMPCWVEEGQAISHTSWKVLIPTIRKLRKLQQGVEIDMSDPNELLTHRP